MNTKQIEYRIRGFSGYFHIEVYGYERVGVLWWARKKWGWYNTNQLGGVKQRHGTDEETSFSDSFNSLDQAKEQIKKWEYDFILGNSNITLEYKN